jgi:hypothetical protein
MEKADSSIAKWKQTRLEIANWPGLCVFVYHVGDGIYQPRILSQQNGSVVYASALCDEWGRIYSWNELWVQDPFAGIDQMNPACLSSNNSLIDETWQRYATRIDTSTSQEVIRIGYDTPGCNAIWLDAQGSGIDVAASKWRLCVDESLLEKFRLSQYASTTHRYLWDGDATDPKFIACTHGAQGGANVTCLSKIWNGCQPINPCGSMMFLKQSNSLTLPSFCEILSGNSDSRILRKSLRTPELRHAALFGSVDVANINSGLFFSKRNTPGQLAEIFHIKLCVIKGMICAVRDSVAQNQCPHFLISPESFHVSLAEPCSALPFLWAHQVSLIDLPHSMRKEIGDVREPVIIPLITCVNSIYRAPAINGYLKAKGTVRLRKVTDPDDEGLVMIEGTLKTDQVIRPNKLDLFTLEWALPRGGRKQIVCRLEARSAETDADYRFVSLPTKNDPEVIYIVSNLKQSINSEPIDFLFIPRLGSTCDLYSLAVTCLRVLLNHPEGLAVMLDDLMGLLNVYKKRIGHSEWQTGLGSLADFVKSGEAGDIVTRLGPQRIIANEELNSSEAFLEIPSSLWWTTINFLLRLIPGECQNSFAASYDDFQPRAMHEVFRQPIEELEILIEKSRSIIFGNSHSNREILNAIRQSNKQ